MPPEQVTHEAVSANHARKRVELQTHLMAKTLAVGHLYLLLIQPILGVTIMLVIRAM